MKDRKIGSTISMQAQCEEGFYRRYPAWGSHAYLWIEISTSYCISRQLVPRNLRLGAVQALRDTLVSPPFVS